MTCKMFGFLSFLLPLLLWASVTKAADRYTSEFMHQSAPKVFELKPRLDYDDGTLYSQTPGTHVDISGIQLFVKGEYGFGELLSAGLLIGYTDLTTKNNISKSEMDQTGLNDITFFLNGDLNSGSGGAFRFGLALELSPSKYTVESEAGTNVEKVSAYSGGFFAIPYVGYEFYRGLHTFGAKVMYQALLSGRSGTVDGASAKVTGGEEWTTSLFYEYEADPAVIGVSLDLINERNEEKNIGGVTTSLGAGRSSFRTSFYLPAKVSSSLTLLPLLSLEKITIYDSTIYGSGSNVLTFSLGLRVEL
jgi:hypothetical protein